MRLCYAPTPTGPRAVFVGRTYVRSDGFQKASQAGAVCVENREVLLTWLVVSSVGSSWEWHLTR